MSIALTSILEMSAAPHTTGLCMSAVGGALGQTYPDATQVACPSKGYTWPEWSQDRPSHPQTAPFVTNRGVDPSPVNSLIKSLEMKETF